MKRILIAVLSSLLVVGVVATPALAGPPKVVTVDWHEDGVRYSFNGSVQDSWTSSNLGQVDFLQTGQTYHVVNLTQMYSISVPDVKGSLIINAAGKLSAETTYTSPTKLLLIRDRIKGEVTIDPQAGTVNGTYIQYRQCFGSQAEVLAAFPYAIPEKSPKAKGWWFIDYTCYTVY